jgi:hypothetical protein
MRAILIGSILLFLSASTAVAETYVPELITSYRQIINVSPFAIAVPTVVEVPLSTSNERKSILVIENETEILVPSYLNEQYVVKPVEYTNDVVINGKSTPGWALLDRSSETGISFLLPEDRRGEATIRLTSAMPTTVSSLHFDFARNVLMATTIEIRAVVDGYERIILSEIPLERESVNFIPTTATSWSVRLRYAQPLEIQEVTLVQDNAEQTVTRGVRFLAQPGKAYRIYHDADKAVQIPYRESGNLSDNRGVIMVNAFTTQYNPLFVPADSDADGVADSFDNCVSTANPMQEDIDLSRVGDACEDFDRDRRLNSNDNCPTIANSDQRDEDGDGIGDACDKEESRLTERLPWVPWVGMGTAALVLVGLFGLVVSDMRRNPRNKE